MLEEYSRQHYTNYLNLETNILSRAKVEGYWKERSRDDVSDGKQMPWLIMDEMWPTESGVKTAKDIRHSDTGQGSTFQCVLDVNRNRSSVYDEG